MSATVVRLPRGLSIPEALPLRRDPHLYESLQKVITWSQQIAAFLAQGDFGAVTVSEGDTWAESTTTGDGVGLTFAFATPIVTLKGVWIGGQAQRPSQCTVVGGALVLDPLIPPPTADEKVTALYR